jgi:hypothetical protein
VLIEDKASGIHPIRELIREGLHAVTRDQPQLDKIMPLGVAKRQRLSRQAIPGS